MALKSGKGYSSPQKVSPARSSRGQIPPGGDTLFECGQHQGLSYDEIVHRFPGYVVWGRTQKSPSLYLARFLDYCQNYYIIDQETMEVQRRDIPLDRTPPPTLDLIAVPATSAHSKARKKPPHPPLPVSCKQCTDFSRQGTNAYYSIQTCRDCGKVTKTKKEREEKDIAS